jgi:putative endonuclease
MAVGNRDPQDVSMSWGFCFLWKITFMETYFVYIIYSQSGDCYYRGFSENPEKRLLQHNNQESLYTSRHGDWTIIYLERFETKREALIREKGLKKYSKIQIRELIKSPKNILIG